MGVQYLMYTMCVCVCVRGCETHLYSLKSNKKMNTPVSTTRPKKLNIQNPEAPTGMPASAAGSCLAGVGWKGRVCWEQWSQQTRFQPQFQPPLLAPRGSVALGPLLNSES